MKSIFNVRFSQLAADVYFGENSGSSDRADKWLRRGLYLTLDFAGRYKQYEFDSSRAKSKVCTRTDGRGGVTLSLEWPDAENARDLVYWTLYGQHLDKKFLIIEACRQTRWKLVKTLAQAVVSLHTLASGPQLYRLQLKPLDANTNANGGDSSSGEDKKQSQAVTIMVQLRCQMTQWCPAATVRWSNLQWTGSGSSGDGTDAASWQARLVRLDTAITAAEHQQTKQQQVNYNKEATVAVSADDWLRMAIWFWHLSSSTESAAATLLPVGSYYQPQRLGQALDFELPVVCVSSKKLQLPTGAQPLRCTTWLRGQVTFDQGGPGYHQLSADACGNEAGVLLAGRARRFFPLPKAWAVSGVQRLASDADTIAQHLRLLLRYLYCQDSNGKDKDNDAKGHNGNQLFDMEQKLAIGPVDCTTMPFGEALRLLWLVWLDYYDAWQLRRCTQIQQQVAEWRRTPPSSSATDQDFEHLLQVQARGYADLWKRYCAARVRLFLRYRQPLPTSQDVASCRLE